MPKYITKKKLDREKLFDYCDDNGVIYDLTVYEDTVDQEDSGILDSSGTPIYRVVEKEPMGYLEFENSDE